MRVPQHYSKRWRERWGTELPQLRLTKLWKTTLRSLGSRTKLTMRTAYFTLGNATVWRVCSRVVEACATAKGSSPGKGLSLSCNSLCWRRSVDKKAQACLLGSHVPSALAGIARVVAMTREDTRRYCKLLESLLENRHRIRRHVLVLSRNPFCNDAVETTPKHEGRDMYAQRLLSNMSIVKRGLEKKSDIKPITALVGASTLLPTRCLTRPSRS